MQPPATCSNTFCSTQLSIYRRDGEHECQSCRRERVELTSAEHQRDRVRQQLVRSHSYHILSDEVVSLYVDARALVARR